MKPSKQQHALSYLPKGAQRYRSKRQLHELWSKRFYTTFWLTMIAAIIWLWYSVISLLLAQGLSDAHLDNYRPENATEVHPPLPSSTRRL